MSLSRIWLEYHTRPGQPFLLRECVCFFFLLLLVCSLPWGPWWGLPPPKVGGTYGILDDSEAHDARAQAGRQQCRAAELVVGRRGSRGPQERASSYGCGFDSFGIPFWLVGAFTTHFRTYFSGWMGMFTEGTFNIQTRYFGTVAPSPITCGRCFLLEDVD